MPRGRGRCEEGARGHTALCRVSSSRVGSLEAASPTGQDGLMTCFFCTLRVGRRGCLPSFPCLDDRDGCCYAVECDPGRLHTLHPSLLLPSETRRRLVCCGRARDSAITCRVANGRTSIAYYRCHGMLSCSLYNLTHCIKRWGSSGPSVSGVYPSKRSPAACTRHPAERREK